MIGKYFILLITIGAAVAIQPVPVKVYYEALCSDSMKFFTDQLIPTWKELKDYMQLELIPYGKTTSTGTPPSVTFVCHHGANECDGNRFQSCLIDPASNVKIEDQIAFLDCLMRNPDATRLYDNRVDACEKTATAPSVNMQRLNSCAKGPDGNRLLYDFGQKSQTAQNPLKSVPAVIFRNAYPLDDAVSAEAVKSFKSSLCKLITDNPKPKACEGNGAPITTVGLMTLFAAGLVVRML